MTAKELKKKNNMPNFKKNPSPLKKYTCKVGANNKMACETTFEPKKMKSPLKKSRSPYKMAGMSWKEGQEPVKNLKKASPAKSGPIPWMLLGKIAVALGVTKGVEKAITGYQQGKQQQRQLEYEEKREEIRQKERKEDIQLALDQERRSMGMGMAQAMLSGFSSSRY